VRSLLSLQQRPIEQTDMEQQGRALLLKMCTVLPAWLVGSAGACDSMSYRLISLIVNFIRLCSTLPKPMLWASIENFIPA
jgi:hypothetical protein